MAEWDESVEILSGPDWQYVPSLSGSYYVKVELVKGRTRVDGVSNREILYHRTSYTETLSGEYDTLFLLPFGLEAVSGDDYRA